MTDNNALAQELEQICSRWDDTDSLDSTTAKGRAFQLACLVANNRETILAALRTPAPAPVGGELSGYDREAAGQAAERIYGKRVADMIRTGQMDGHHLVDAFKAHRIAALQSRPAPNCPTCGDPACQWGGVPANCQMWGKEPPAPEQEDAVERVAKAIAKANGDEFANAFKSKDRWTAKRGMSGGRFRDVNEPFQTDYLDMARAALAAMQPKVEAPAADSVRSIVQTLCDALTQHHQWHAAQTTPDPGHGYILADEYADSGMYERTVDALHKASRLLEPSPNRAAIRSGGAS